jgi:hypothetical protein
MPSKRDVLAILTRDELPAVVDRFESSPPDRRAKGVLVETVASAKKATEKLRTIVVAQPPPDEQAAIAMSFDVIVERVRAEAATLGALGPSSPACLRARLRVKPDEEAP